MDTRHNSTLRALARQRGILMGTAANARALRTDYTYREVLAQEFNLLTPENEMKFGPLAPSPDSYDFGPAREIVDFAQANDMSVRGHTLLWHQMNPAWLKEGNYTHSQARALMHRHIFTVMGQFHGEIAAWDVLNEALADTGGLRDSFWLHTIGPDYIEQAFRWAAEADPKAKLFYNDYAVEGMNPKSDAMYELVKTLLERGVPLHGVGLQMHLALREAENFAKPPTVQEMEDNLGRFAELGLEIHITEMDVQIQGLNGSMEDRLEKQARVYEDVLTVALRCPQLKAFILWGFTDRHSWIPKFTGHEDAATPFDETYQPKPAYEALYRALKAH